MKRDDEAVTAFRAAAERAPASFEVWSELGIHLHALERFDEARAVLERALELEPPPAWPSELRASSKERLRELLTE
jgi:Flp pilus assembly protein TadD